MYFLGKITAHHKKKGAIIIGKIQNRSGIWGGTRPEKKSICCCRRFFFQLVYSTLIIFSSSLFTLLLLVITTMAVGVLALQGSYNEHIAALRKIGAKGVEIRKGTQLQGVDALIIPGGESTTMAKLAEHHNLVRNYVSPFFFPSFLYLINSSLRKIGAKGVEIRKGTQLQGVDALIIPGGESTTMAKLAEHHNLFPALREFVGAGKPVWGTCAGLIFLANKAIGQKSGGQELIGGLDCTVHRNFFGSQLQSFEIELSVPKLAEKEGGSGTCRGVIVTPNGNNQEEEKISKDQVIVAVRQGNLLATAFHPELTSDLRWHSFFLKMVKEINDKGSQCVSSSDKDIEERPWKRPLDLPIFE
uniref:glutaminase n=1 Tax=Ananas comosus var. bracteatus TaxID=296719 RepID=A0A6V7Q9J2_ANACO|nr:unnamed protein product [Ananas comosus var. bracteatus]